MDDEKYESDEALTPEEELNAENEMELLRLSLEYGAESYIDDNAPAEVISLFLQQIREFEQNFRQDPQMVTIRESIGERISIIPSEHVNDLELELTIETLLVDFYEQGIAIDRPEHLSPRAYYDFLTGDFLDEYILEQRPPGFIVDFVYGEIFEDAPEFIMENARFEIENILDIRYTFRGFHLASLVMVDGYYEDKNLLIEAVQRWQSQFKAIDQVVIEPDEEIQDEDMYHVTFDVSYIRTDRQGVTQNISGLAVMTMILEDRHWSVCRLNIPGFSINAE